VEQHYRNLEVANTVSIKVLEIEVLLVHTETGPQVKTDQLLTGVHSSKLTMSDA